MNVFLKNPHNLDKNPRMLVGRLKQSFIKHKCESVKTLKLVSSRVVLIATFRVDGSERGCKYGEFC